jgi:lipid A 3-O-deacylase
MKWMCLGSVCLICVHGSAEGVSLVDALSVGAGQSLGGIDIGRVGVIKDSGCRFLTSDVGWLSLYFEAALNFWKKGDEEVYGGAFSPVFYYAFGDAEDSVFPYIEAGIGVAGISDTQLDDRDFSTGFQFEDRIGFGLRVNKTDFNLRYMHYSNGSIAEPNDGLDTLVFTVAYRF